LEIKAFFLSDNYKLTQDYGVPWFNDASVQHNGIDLSAPKFTPIYAPITGIITRASYHYEDDKHAFGNRISIDFDNVHELYIAHLDGIDVTIKVGYSIECGFIIGRMGSTGSSSGNHIHIGIRKKKLDTYGKVVWLNPYEFIG